MKTQRDVWYIFLDKTSYLGVLFNLLGIFAQSR